MWCHRVVTVLLINYLLNKVDWKSTRFGLAEKGSAWMSRGDQYYMKMVYNCRHFSDSCSRSSVVDFAGVRGSFYVVTSGE